MRRLDQKRSTTKVNRGHHSSLSARVLDRVMTKVGSLGASGPALLVVDENDPASVELLSMLRRSLDILGRSGPSLARWLQRYVHRVVLVPAIGRRASYRHSSRSVFLRVDSAQAHDELGLAAILAHETTHARICARLGHWILRPASRARIEYRCVSEQLGVLLAEDESHYLVNWSRDLLEDLRVGAGIKAPAERTAMV